MRDQVVAFIYAIVGETNHSRLLEPKSGCCNTLERVPDPSLPVPPTSALFRQAPAKSSGRGRWRDSDAPRLRRRHRHAFLHKIEGADVLPTQFHAILGWSGNK